MTDTGFADDIAVTSSIIDNLQTLTDNIVREASCVGLLFNVNKTKIMAVGAAAVAAPVVVVYGKAIKRVEDFKFLGAWVRSSLKDFMIRRALAFDAARKMLAVWTSRTIPDWAKGSYSKRPWSPS